MTFQYSISTATAAIDFIGSFIIFISVIIILSRYLFQNSSLYRIENLRLELAKIIILALSLKTGAGILRSILVNNWESFFLFASIVALRFFLGKTLNWNNKNNFHKSYQ